MSERILLIDSNVFVLLSAAALLDALIACLRGKQKGQRGKQKGQVSLN